MVKWKFIALSLTAQESKNKFFKLELCVCVWLQWMWVLVGILGWKFLKWSTCLKLKDQNNKKILILLFKKFKFKKAVKSKAFPQGRFHPFFIFQLDNFLLPSLSFCSWTNNLYEKFSPSTLYSRHLDPISYFLACGCGRRTKFDLFDAVLIGNSDFIS